MSDEDVDALLEMLARRERRKQDDNTFFRGVVAGPAGQVTEEMLKRMMHGLDPRGAEPREERVEEERHIMNAVQAGDDPSVMEYSVSDERIVKLSGVWGLFTPFDDEELEELDLPQPERRRGEHVTYMGPGTFRMDGTERR